jgi:G3E family GTPase
MNAGALPGVPAVVIGGYLGAGKTTLVNELLRQADGQRIAVLVNDFGELAIDADLIVGASGDVLALAGGCVCCSFGADLVGTLRQALQRTPRPERVLIECSGVGLPAAVARTARLLPSIDLCGVVTVVAAAGLRQRAGDPYVGDTVRQQVADADAVVLNQVDRCNAAELDAARHWLAAAAPGRRVWETSRAAVPADLLWEPAPDTRQAGDRPARAFADVAVPATARFRSEALCLDPPIDPQAIVAALCAPESDVLRAKGWIVDAGGRGWLLQLAGSDLNLTPASPPGGPASANRLLVIRLLRDDRNPAPTA